ncbi:MAG: hypothetical protein IKB77_04615 [Lentisphaeria bacterium]|nr:hypothetical protein [Lentisphaeria bacterium]
MQTIRKILRISGGESAFTDDYGKKTAAPMIKIGIAYKLEIDLRSDIVDEESGILLPMPFDELSEATGFYLSIDSDWDHDTDPKHFRTSDISIVQTEDGRTVLNASLPNTATPKLLEAVAKNKSVNLTCEVCGYSAENGSTVDAVFAFDFEFALRNRQFIGDQIPTEDDAASNGWLNEAQVRALIVEVAKSDIPGPDGLSAYEIAKKRHGYTGSEAQWLESLKGERGKDMYELYCEIEQTAGREPLALDEWLESLKGKNGEPGKSNYELAKDLGFEGDLADFIESQKGEPGKGLDFDATGSFEMRSLYDAEKEGFKYASSVYDDTQRITQLYFWYKESDVVGDWSDPMIVKLYGNIGQHTIFTTIAPLEILPYDDDELHDYFFFDLTAYPHATVAAVTLETIEGEITLPVSSDYGVRKILKKRTYKQVLEEGKYVDVLDKVEVRLFFGANIPQWTKGYVYLSQMLAPQASPDIEIGEVTVGKIYYGFINDNTLNSVTAVTADHIAAAIEAGTLKESEAMAMNKTSLGTITDGSFAYIAVPAGYIVSKDNGFGGKVIFEVNGDLPNSGANGTEVILNEQKMYVYGEFKASAAELFIYIDKN